MDIVRLARKPGWQTAAIMALLAGWLLHRAAGLGLDANWDLRNYHLYNPFAWLHGKWAIDWMPAQPQGYAEPLLDLPFYWLQRRITAVPVLNMLLALPHILAVLLAFLLSLRLLWPRDRMSTMIVALVATLIGATGAAGLPVLASSMSDMAAVALVLGSLLLLLPMPEKGWPAWRVFLAGALTGAAVGLRLPLASAALGLAMAISVPRQPFRMRLARLLLLAAGGLSGAALLTGWWYWRVWQVWGDPIFPFANNLFHARWAAPTSFFDLRFLPQTIHQALIAPLLLATQVTTLFGEAPARDPRLPLALLASVWLLRRRDTAAMLGAFLLVDFVVWEARFSVLRYLAVAELLAGLPPAILLTRWLTDEHRWGRLPGLLALFAGLLFWTVYPEWGRLPPGERIRVQMPRLDPHAMVLMLDQSPMSYLAVYQTLTTRFVGANNNLVSLHRPTRYAPLLNQVRSMIKHQITTYPTELWGLDMPEAAPGQSDAALRFYGLGRAECLRIHTDLDGDHIRLCRLQPQ